MATNLNTIKNWFKTGLKPTQAQFWAWMDSYWHKDQTIPTNKIDGLENALNSKASNDQLAGKVDRGGYEGTAQDLADAIENIPEQVEELLSDAGNRTVKLVTDEDPYFLIQSDDNKFLTITTEFDPVLSLGFTANTEFWIKNTSPTPREVTFDTDIEFIGSPLIPTNGLAILKLIEVVGGIEYWSINHLLANGTPSGDGFKKNIFFTTSLADLGLTTFDELTNEIVKDWIDSLEIVENDNEIYYYEITDEVETTYNFELTSPNWAFEGVTDEASFFNFLAYRANLASNDLNNIVITDFSYVGNTIKCNMTADGTTYDLSDLGLQNVNKIGIVNGLQYLELSYNQITAFNPTIALPNTLQILILSYNQIDNSGWETSEDWITNQPSFTNSCVIGTRGNVDTAIGTDFETIVNTKNAYINE